MTPITFSDKMDKSYQKRPDFEVSQKRNMLVINRSRYCYKKDVFWNTWLSSNYTILTIGKNQIYW